MEVKTRFVSRVIGVKSTFTAQGFLRIAVSNFPEANYPSTIEKILAEDKLMNFLGNHSSFRTALPFILFLFSIGLRLVFAYSPVAGVLFAEEAFSY